MGVAIAFVDLLYPTYGTTHEIDAYGAVRNRPYRVWVNVCLFFWFTINDPMESKLKSQYPESKPGGETPPLRKEGYTYF